MSDKPTIIRLADAPQSSAAHWTPEDMLRATLADIESGKLKPTKGIVILYGSIDELEDKFISRVAGTRSGFESTGLLTEALVARCMEA